MGKGRKAVVDLRNLEIGYEEGDERIRLLRFDRNAMRVEAEIRRGDSVSQREIAFAHLPRTVKQKLKPL